MCGLGVVGLGDGPDVLVLLEPVADGAFHADVEAGVSGLDPLVFEDLLALSEEILPEIGLGDGLGDVGRGALAVGVLVLCEGRDGELEEIEGCRGEIDLGRGFGFVLCGDRQGAAFVNVLLGDDSNVAASGQAQGAGTDVNAGQEFPCKGDRNGSLSR